MLRSVNGLLKTVIASSFFKNASGITLSVALNQLLLLIALVFMSRVFQQELIGSYGAFLSLATILSAANLLSYHLSLPNVKTSVEAKNLLWLLIGLSIITSAILLLLLILLDKSESVALSLFVFFRSVMLICEQNSIRKQVYWPLICSRILVPIFFLVGIVYCHYWNPTLEGVIWSHVLSLIIVSSLYSTVLLPDLKTGGGFRGCSTWTDIITIAKTQRRFSMWVTPATLLNIAAYHLPTILIEQFLSAVAAAQYTIAMRSCQGFISMLGQSISQVFHGRIASIMRTSKVGAWLFFMKVNAMLWVLGFASAIAIYFGIPRIIEIFFGENWETAQLIVQIMAPLFGVMLIVASLSSVHYVFGAQRALYFNQLLYFVISMFSFSLAVSTEDLMLGICVFTVLSLLRYTGIYVFIFMITKRNFVV